jgi:hypothetical protein
LENTQYYSLLAINAAYYLDSLVLMEGYQISHQRDSITFTTHMPANRSKSVYHSKNTIKKKKKEKRKHASIVDLPQRDDILRILRMRHEQDVAVFLQNEFQKRNTMKPMDVELPESPTSLPDMPPPLPAHGVSLVD